MRLTGGGSVTSNVQIRLSTVGVVQPPEMSCWSLKPSSIINADHWSNDMSIGWSKWTTTVYSWASADQATWVICGSDGPSLANARAPKKLRDAAVRSDDAALDEDPLPGL